MIFSEATYSTLQGLLGQDVPTFSIVREPVARFISSMRFFGITGLERHGISLLNLNDASVNKLLDLLEDRQYVNKMRENQRLHSILSYPSDFGITKDPFIGRDEFDKKFRKAQSRVGVVVLTEDWFLSMAMLRQYLHIPLEDLVWNNLKRAKRQPLQLSDETTARIRRLLWKDVRIYEHYKQQFYDQVTPTMRAEAEVFAPRHNDVIEEPILPPHLPSLPCVANGRAIRQSLSIYPLGSRPCARGCAAL